MAQISVITVTKDNFASLEKTLDSIALQDFKDFELIVVCGGDFKSTQSLLNRYKDKISEITLIKDNGTGIYSAMNFGIQSCASEYIWFMNSGDCFATQKSMASGIKLVRKLDADLIIGNYLVDGSLRQVRFKKELDLASPEKISKSIRKTCHQSMIFRAESIRQQGLFSSQYRIAADFDLILRISAKKKTYWWNQVLSIIEPYGISDTQLCNVLREKQDIRKQIFGTSSYPSLVGYTLTIGILAKAKIRFLRNLMTYRKKCRNQRKTES